MVKGVMGARSGFGMLLPSRRWLSALAGLAALSVAGPASATTISGSMTADDSFTAYLSTSDASLGTPIASGSNWGFAYSFSTVSLTPGQNYYLHIEAYDAAPPGGFIGSFTLSDSGFAFVNGSQTLDTNTTDWVGNINTQEAGPRRAAPSSISAGTALAPGTGIHRSTARRCGFGPATAYRTAEPARSAQWTCRPRSSPPRPQCPSLLPGC